MPEPKTMVAVSAKRIEAEEAVRVLQCAGVDARAMSGVAKDTRTDELVAGYREAADRMKYWGKTGAFWGGFW